MRILEGEGLIYRVPGLGYYISYVYISYVAAHD